MVLVGETAGTEAKNILFTNSSGTDLIVDRGWFGIQPAEQLEWFIVHAECVFRSPALLQIIEGRWFSPAVLKLVKCHIITSCHGDK